MLLTLVRIKQTKHAVMGVCWWDMERKVCVTWNAWRMRERLRRNWWITY